MWCGWGYDACGRAMRVTDCEVCAEGWAAMDAGWIGRKGVASLVPALEKMPQLTSLYLGRARIRFWARRRGVGGVFFFGCVVLGTRLDAVWGVVGVCAWRWAMRVTDCEVCAEGWEAMDAGNRIRREGAASLAPALEKMPQLTSLDLGCARIRFWARPRGVGGVFFFGCVVLGTRLDAMCCAWGYALAAGDAADDLRGVCRGAGGDGCRQSDRA
jgi:hypothetical protein